MTHPLDGKELRQSTDYRETITKRYFLNKKDAVTYVNDLLTVYGKSKTFRSITITKAEELGAFYVFTATIDFYQPSEKILISRNALPNI